MNLKVIKPIKGLVEGDILYYNQDADQYEITKIEEDVSDNKTSKKTLKVIIGAWLVDDNKEFFKYVDDDGNDMTVEEFKYEQKEEDKIININSGELESLRKENEELKQKMMDLIEKHSEPVIHSYELEDLCVKLKKDKTELEKRVDSLWQDNSRLQKEFTAHITPDRYLGYRRLPLLQLIDF
jgi:NAD kinase